MAVTKCKECGGKLATSAKVCPHCGAREKRIGLLGWLVLIFIVFPAVLGLFLAGTAEQERSGGSASAQQPARVSAEEPSNSQSGSALIKEHCTLIGEFAKGAMTSRQAGELMTEVEAQNDAILESIVIDAYERPRFLGAEYQARAIFDFQNDVYLKCIKGQL